MTPAVDVPQLGDTIEGPRFSVTRETIREFCDGSLDYNPLHLDDEFMRGRFGKTEFGGVIMHGMTNFGLITRMLTDWLYPRGGIHRRLETRWLAPVRPGDSIQPLGVVAAEKTTTGAAGSASISRFAISGASRSRAARRSSSFLCRPRTDALSAACSCRS